MKPVTFKPERHIVAEDEISTLYGETATIVNMDQLAEAARRSQQDNFWPIIRRLADECDNVLTDQRFPCAAEMVAHDGAGNWRRMTAQEAQAESELGKPLHITRGANLAQAKADLSDAWYAGKIGLKCREALEHFEAGKAGQPFLFLMIFEIASWRKDWQWRRGYKPSIVTGQKQRKGLSAHRNTAIAKVKAVMQRRREVIAALLVNTNRTGGALEAWLEKNLTAQGISASRRTIRRDLAALRGA